MSTTLEYAVVNPATGETLKRFDSISDDDLRDAIGRAHAAHEDWNRSTTVADRAAVIRRVGELHEERKQELGEIIVREMGKPIEQAVGEVEFCKAIYDFFADNAEELLADEEIKLLDGDGPRLRAQELLRRPARDHAVELPLLPGGPLRGTEPRDRQHGPAQARAAVPRVRGGDGADLPRRRRPADAYINIYASTSRSSRSSPTRACAASR
jgi:succinate-semialdehyde dehydrogenase/glutarate-semialdehyde dehydrogenase